MKDYTMANEKLSVTYYQTSLDVFWSLGLERPEKRKINVKKIEKLCTCCKKNAKIREVKMLKPFHQHKKLCSNLLQNPRGVFWTPSLKKNCEN